MKPRGALKIFLTALCCLLIVSIIPVQAFAAEPVTVRIGWFYQDGYQELDNNGSPCGYNYEYLCRIAAANSWKLEFVTDNGSGEPLSWDDCLTMLVAGELDIMGCFFYSEEREDIYDFTSLSAGQTFTSLFVRSDSSLESYDYESLNGITVAVNMASINDESLDEYAMEYGFSISKYVDCATFDDCVDAVLEGRADAGVLTSYQPTSDTRIIASFAPQSFYFATTKGNTEVLVGLNRAINSIYLKDPYYTQTLAAKYNQTYSGKSAYTEEELSYIANAEPIKVCFSNAWHSLIQYDETTGTATGVIADVLGMISAATGLEYEYHHVETHAEAVELVSTGACDMLPCNIYDVATAEKHLLYQTDPYLNIQLVRVSKTDQSEKNLIVGTVADFPNLDKAVKGDHISYKYYNSAEECFEALRQGEVTDIVVHSYAANYYHSLSKYASFVRTNLQGITMHTCMNVSKSIDYGSVLVSVIDKALSNISATDINELLLEDTVDQGGNLEIMINRIPTLTVLWITLSLFLLLGVVIFLLFSFLRKAKQAKTAAERINSLLVIDQLTGAYNERGFELAARKAIDENPYLQWFLVDFDIDGFSRYWTAIIKRDTHSARKQL